MRRRQSEFLILALDIGTSSTRTALFDDKGNRLTETTAAEQYSVSYGADGKAELSSTHLLNAARRTCRRTLSIGSAKGPPIAAVGGSAFWHGLLGLNKRLRPVTPVFTWADSRAADQARQLRDDFDEHAILQRTGCMIRSTFWPAKLRWLNRFDSKSFRAVAHWISPCDWIFSELFGELRSSPSMASATGLYNLATKSWDDELVRTCRINRNTLPELSDRLESPRLGKDLKGATVFCSIGDGAAGNLGSGATRRQVAAVNVGTSAAVRTIQSSAVGLNVGIPRGLFRYVVDANRTILGGATSNAGNLRQWSRHQLRIPRQSGDLEGLLSRKAAAADSLTILPFWVEERAPTWPERIPGVIHGLNQSTTAPEIARATATAVFYRIGQIIAEIERSLGRMKRIIVSGGILHSKASVALLADAIGRDVEISREPEASIRGAAVYALEQLGVKVSAGPRNRILKHNRALAAKHVARQDRQIELERILRR
jgi:gluconokinase